MDNEQTFDWKGISEEISYLSSSYEESELESSNLTLEINEKSDNCEIENLKKENNSLLHKNKNLETKIEKLENHIDDISLAIQECLIESGMFTKKDFNL